MEYKFDRLETLRGFLAWWVVIFHALAFTGLLHVFGNPFIMLLSHGELAVDAFMILSGIVISHLITIKDESYIIYIIRRFFRLSPVFYFALIISIILQPLYLSVFKDLSTLINPDSFASKIERIYQFWEYPVYHIILHLALLHGAVPDNLLKYSSTSIITPAWSISLEWQFYLIAPLLIKSIKRINGEIVIVVLTICLALIRYFSSIEFQGAFFPFQINLFMIGIYFYFIYTSTMNSKKFKWIFFAVFYLLLSISIKPLVTVPVLIVFLVFFFPWVKRKFKWLSFFDLLSKDSNFFRRLGIVSYSTYLLHQAVQLIIIYVIIHFLRIHSNVMLFWIAFPLSSFLIYLISLFTYRNIELVGIEFGKKYFLKNKHMIKPKQEV